MSKDDEILSDSEPLGKVGPPSYPPTPVKTPPRSPEALESGDLSAFPSTKIDLDKVFCMAAKEFNLDRILLKAVATVESSLNPMAYRFEPKYWDRYLADNADFNHMEPERAAASYGLMQIMYPTAVMFGFTGEPEELYEPVYNVMLGARIIRLHINKITESTNVTFWPIDIALARYNGGNRRNPGPDGKLRNIAYLKKVKQAYWDLLGEGEHDCDD